MDIASYVYTVSSPLAGIHRYLSLKWTYQSHHLPRQGMIRKRKRKKVPAHFWDTDFNGLSSIFPLENCSLGYISHPFVGPACTPSTYSWSTPRLYVILTCSHGPLSGLPRELCRRLVRITGGGWLFCCFPKLETHGKWDFVRNTCGKPNKSRTHP